MIIKRGHINKKIIYPCVNTGKNITELLLNVMKQIIFFWVLLLSSSSLVYMQAKSYHIGSGQNYPNPNALYQADVLQDGDTLLIEAATYSGQEALAVWDNHDLFIKGMNGKPILVANGAYIQGKGIWVLKGNNITVENIEFSGAKVPDKNGAGIRLDGTGLNIRHCYFRDNENGILTSNPYSGEILIEFTEFAHNGYGDGYSHNLYIGHVSKLIFRFNYSHHCKIGHNLKSRADENYILYNRIMDEESGNSSRLIDLPNGGTSIVMGNILMQGKNASNNNLTGYGKEGLSNNSPHELYFLHNTMINKREVSCIFLDIKEGTDIAHVSNNIFGGNGTSVSGNTTTMENNLEESIIDALFLLDEANYDYRLTKASPALDAGKNIDISVNGYLLQPAYSYKHPLHQQTRTVVGESIDVGAYEYGELVGLFDDEQINQILILPNPVSNHLYIINDTESIAKSIAIYDIGGVEVYKDLKPSKSINLSNFPNGIYFIKILSSKSIYFIQRFIKQ